MRLLRLLRRRIALKLTLTLVGFVALAVLAAGLYLDRALEGLAVEALEARQVTAAGVLADEARRALRGSGGEPPPAFASRAARLTGARVTLIAADGRVVGESERTAEETARLDNHGDRPEVRAALAGRPGRDLRASATVGAPLLYTAVPLMDGAAVAGVLRLALPVGAVTDSRARVAEVLWLGAGVALLVAFGIGVFVAGRVTRPIVEMQSVARLMSEGHFDARAPTRSPDEIGALGRSLNVMASRLREKIGDLEQERATVAAILDAMVEGVIAVDGRERVVLVNGRARGMFGISGRRVEGRPFLELVRSADLHEVFRACRDAPPGSVLERELRLSAPGERLLAVHAAPWTRADAGAGVLLVAHDITELRRLEQVRTEFVANVSHELRTPLTAIRGYLETLLAGALEDPEHARRFLEIALRHTERLGRLLDDLTDLSNIELGRVRLTLGAVPLEAVVESVLAIVAGKAEAGRVALERRVPADLPPVRADQDRLAQIVLNLVDNAVKYTPAGGRVTVRAERAEDRAVVSVEDTGVGIPPGDLPRVTERFYRVDRARSRELGGTGLGLAIVKHLVLAHGGELRIESEPGRGTSVRFTLPLASTGDAPAGDAAGRAASG
jgi:two-component system phosphate regulon sensor histidine kinase PhoR